MITIKMEPVDFAHKTGLGVEFIGKDGCRYRNAVLVDNYGTPEDMLKQLKSLVHMIETYLV